MMDLPPFRVSSETAEQLLRDRFGIRGQIAELGSQQDANFKSTTADGRRFVLKIANPGTSSGELELQLAAMRQVAAGRGAVAVPETVAGLDGAELQAVQVGDHIAQAFLVTYLSGENVMDSRYLGPGVVAQLGNVAASTAQSLRGFEHQSSVRALQWNPMRAPEVVADLAHFVSERSRRDRLIRVVGEAQLALAPVAATLPTQVIHGDVTDNNIVFDRDRSGRLVPSGVIDFGDVMHSWRVAELAVLCASLLHHRGATPATILPAVRAFHAEQSLSRHEALALWPLVLQRAAVLVVSGQQQATINPENGYAAAALTREWQILEVADSVPIEVMQAAVLSAIGQQPAVRPVCAGLSILPGLDEGDTAEVDLSYTNGALHPGGWASPKSERALIEELLGSGFPAAATRYGEYRITRAETNRVCATPTLALGVEVRTRETQRVVAPWPCHVRRTSDGALALRADGLSLILDGFAPAGTEGPVERGRLLGMTGEEPLWVQLSWVGSSPPPFVSPELQDAWLVTCPDPTPILPIRAGSRTEQQHAAPVLAERRKRTLATVQERYYSEPPQVEVGWREHLIDVEAQTYVDMVNNVTVLGHGHPRLADAVNRQWRRLNTNSRFHYAKVVEFSERLTALLPEELDTVFLVNSGSEAVDLALRLAWAATGRRDVVSVREAYHGWTDATDAISTSTADNPDAIDSRPDWVHTVDAPNVYRGRYRGDQTHRYAEDVVARVTNLASSGRPPAAFICEPFYGNAGGMALPDNYLRDIYAAVRGVGGVCIADEVQVGYGRLGRWFWGFEQQGVVPDVVTVAKGMGNGHPLGAVITSESIAERYRSQGYFFSSAGGSPVSSAVGLTVLDVLRDERLQENARRVGTYLKDKLLRLAERHPLIGAVHGEGLYLGLEFVRDRVTREPATEETAAICERLLDLGIIVQPTSDRMCVLKIKPPLCLSKGSADRFVEALDEVLTHGW
jgi:4-aminobutyrate aminotransferase-like enzyme/Ser/Thr protein kinase RdoA (MazF antagonist)